jgi:hypothetical protein
MNDHKSKTLFPPNTTTGLMPFDPIERGTGQRLSIEIPYRIFPRSLSYLGVIVHPETKVRYRITARSCDVEGCNCDAWAERIDDTGLADFFPNVEHDWWSLNVIFSAAAQALIDEHDRPDDPSIFFIHGQLYKTRNATITEEEHRLGFVADLYPSIQEMEQGGGTPAEEVFSRIKKEGRVRLERLKSIEKGNVALPLELYAFVLEQVDSGTFPNPTAFMNAVILSPSEAAKQTLRVHQSKD